MYIKKEAIQAKEGKKFKARLVEKGYSQRKVKDYNEIFPPVVRCTSIRTMYVLIAHLDMQLEHMDVNISFFYGDLEEQFDMVQSEGFTHPRKEHLV